MGEKAEGRGDMIVSKLAEEIVNALSKRWPCLHIEGWDEGEAMEIVDKVLKPAIDVMIHADSELSAIRHGRPPSNKQELEDLYYEIRRQTSKTNI